MVVKVILQDIKKVESDAIVVGFFEDVRPLKGLAGQLDWLLCGSLSGLLLKNKLRGSLGDVALLTAREKVPSPKILMIGFGPWSGFSLSTLRNTARTVASSVLGVGATHAALECLLPTDASCDAGMSALRKGLEEGAGGRSLAISLLASDRETYEKLFRLVKA
ncbi:MAG: M17 family peptidase N-terminal domain-containing protein [Betaproteobacteria bacterium]